MLSPRTKRYVHRTSAKSSCLTWKKSLIVLIFYEKEIASHLESSDPLPRVCMR